MDCKDIPDLIQPYVDGELEPTLAAAVAAHLRQCPGCARLVEEQRALGHAIRTAAPRVPVPDRLQTRIRLAPAGEARGSWPTVPDAAAPPQPMPSRATPAAPVSRVPWRPLALAASFALAIVTSSGLTAYLTQPGSGD